MGGEKGLTHLQEILRGLCFRTPWKYGVFWRLHQRDNVVLTWEEAYSANYGPVDPSDHIPFYRTFEYLDDRHYLPDPIGKDVMEMSRAVYSLGEGIIGQVASTGKHQWVFADKKSLSHILSLHDCYEGWNSQFSAGIRTIAIVPVVPHGVVQLGSSSTITEDVKLVNHIKDAFHSLQDCSTESITRNLFQCPMQSRLWSQVSPQQTGSEPLSDIPHSSNKVTSKGPDTASPAASPQYDVRAGLEVTGPPRAPQRTGMEPPRVHGIPIRLIANDTELHPSHFCARRMTKVFKRWMIPEGYCWKSVPPHHKDQYWRQWKVFFRWDDASPEDLIRAAYDRLAGIRYTALMHKLKKNRVQPVYVTDAAWSRYLEYWEKKTC